MAIPNIKLIDVGVLIFNKVDLLDVSGPIEVFAAAKIDEPRLRLIENEDKFAAIYQKSPLFNVKLVSVLETEFVTTASGPKLVPDYFIKDLDELKEKKEFNPFIWVIPGGEGIHEIRKDRAFISWLRDAIENAHISLSVCTGAYAVAATGHLDEDEWVTTHWQHFELFSEEFPHLVLANNSRYVDNGSKVITSGGVSAGIDGALQVVARLLSDDVAQRVADTIVYPWLG